MRTSSIFNTQHVLTRRNRVTKRTQHATLNNVAMCCIEYCDRLVKNTFFYLKIDLTSSIKHLKRNVEYIVFVCIGGCVASFALSFGLPMYYLSWTVMIFGRRLFIKWSMSKYDMF